MKQSNKQLIFIFAALVILKVVLASFILAPSAFSDEYFYSKLARNLHNDGELSVYKGVKENYYPPLYPLIISPAYFADDMGDVYFLMKLFNAILSALIIIPAYLLSKEFFPEKRALLISVLVALIPSMFSFTSYILSENLYYTLVMFTFYFFYKSLNESSYKFDVLTGIFLGLSYLTKKTSIALIIAAAIASLVFIIKERKSNHLYRKITLGFFALLTIAPYLVRNASVFGLSVQGVFSFTAIQQSTHIANENYFLTFTAWSVLYIGYMLLFIPPFFISSLNTFKDRKSFYLALTTFLMFLFTIFIASNHNAGYTAATNVSWLLGRPIGRYLDAVMPFIVILGFYGMKKKVNSKSIIVSGVVVAFSSILTLFPLFPSNNFNLTHIGVVKYTLDAFVPYSFIAMLVLLLLIPIASRFLLKLKQDKIIKLVAVYFILINIAAYSVIFYTSNYEWNENEQIKMSRWMNENLPNEASVLIDKRYEGRITKEGKGYLYEGLNARASPTLVGFFINNNIIIGDIEHLGGNNYILTLDELEFKEVKREGELILYKV